MARPKEKPIHYGIFLGVGLAMFIISRILLYRETTRNPEAMLLFSWIGLGFVLIGIIKLIIALNKKGVFKGEERFAEKLAGPEAKLSAPQARDKARQIQQQRLRQQELQQQGVQQPIIITCPVCKTKNYSSSNFCHMCGQRLK
jgi:hypothetical protein